MRDLFEQILQKMTEAGGELIIAVLILTWLVRHLINGRTQ